MLIAVSGNIGAGKTTLVKRLSDHFHYRAEYEAITDNPYLSLFYQDMHRWAFHLQVYFLGHRFKQGLQLKSADEGIILDRTIYEDANIFAKHLYKSGYLNQTDYDNYLNLYHSMLDLIPPPDLLIYLKGKAENLKTRIVQRSEGGERNFERNISLDYLRSLEQCYTSWIDQYSYSKVITIDINNIDLAKEEHFETLVKNIQNLQRCVN